MRAPGKKSKLVAAALLVCVPAFLVPGSAWACAACFGQDSGPMAQGMNWGILSLLAVIVSVLVSVAGFFVFLARRSVPSGTPEARRRSVSGTATGERGRASGNTGNPAPFEPREPRPQTA
jgi:hypothetical protein